jgi:hypothetical protein
MLLKTLGKLSDVKDKRGGFIRVARDSLDRLIAEDTAAARRLSDPLTYDNAVAAHGDVARLTPLVDARRQQRQDWITYTLFFTFLSAVDAYVTAHLTDFPADITVAPAQDGGVSLRLDVPIPGSGRR